MLKKKEKYNVAVMGATGAVGTQFLQILEERSFPSQLMYRVPSTKNGKTAESAG